MSIPFLILFFGLVIVGATSLASLVFRLENPTVTPRILRFPPMVAAVVSMISFILAGEAMHRTVSAWRSCPCDSKIIPRAAPTVSPESLHPSPRTSTPLSKLPT